MEKNEFKSKSLIVLFSYHHNNTEKIAKTMAEILDAEIKMPEQINPEELQDYDLVGFGSGIYSAKHDGSILELADALPEVNNKNAFLFSTAGMTGKSKSAKDHSTLREKLESKGYTVIDEFQCKGFNTNSFLRLFGGMNKGRPNAEDLKNAEEFAQKLKQRELAHN
ncbi:MAG TPA: flavodoxin family protein [Methanobacteriaceae archaeon]|nr:flavodoxin family protein [Methanobacteriaceae archaeon]